MLEKKIGFVAGAGDKIDNALRKAGFHEKVTKSHCGHRGLRVELEDELREKYANVPEENFADYSSFIDVMVHEEEPQCAQELYSILDAGIQQVLTDKDADCASIVKQMAEDFQKNHLDKLD